MSQLSHDNEFCELLFTKPLAHYFSCVYESNMNGFNSSEPAPGVWEAYVYKQNNFRSAVKRIIKPQFIEAVQMLGQHLHDIDEHKSGVSSKKSTEILKYIRENTLTSKPTQLFNMFFNIVDDSRKNYENKATHVSIGDYKHSVSSNVSTNTYRVNVKTVNTGVTAQNAFSNNYKVLSGQQGAGNYKDSLTLTTIALITGYIPLVQTSDGLPTEIELNVKDNRLNYAVSSFQGITDNFNERFDQLSGEIGTLKRSAGSSHIPPASGNANALGEPLTVTGIVGGGLKGGTVEQDRAEVLRLLCEKQFESPTDTLFSVLEVATAVEIASFIACRHPESTNAPSVLNNAVTLAALPTNTWRKLSDGSYEKMTPSGAYEPLSTGECAKLLSTCAGSSLTSEVCTKFMEAVRDQNVDAILQLLASPDVWESNAASESLDNLHPETVLKILKTLKFGTKNGPYGKRVCSVDEWLAECVKDTAYTKATISPNMKSYLNHLVSFVNSNPSLIDPSKRPLARRTTQDEPTVFTERGVYNAYDDMSRSNNNMLTFATVHQAVNAYPYSRVNPNDVYQYGTMAYGAVLRGGNHSIFTQSAQAPLSLGSGIRQLVQQTLNGLRSTSQPVSPVDEELIKEKVDKLTQLEQEIYQHIIQLNNYRVAVESGIDCHSQLTSTQDNLMHLSNSYNRKVPCLQELCEQLRMLLAQQQQQHKQGCEPIQ
jgi:hypothetical protein